MYQKDYILRIIATIMKFIGEVPGLVKKEKYDEASKMLELPSVTFNVGLHRVTNDVQRLCWSISFQLVI